MLPRVGWALRSTPQEQGHVPGHRGTVRQREGQDKPLTGSEPAAGAAATLRPRLCSLPPPPTRPCSPARSPSWALRQPPPTVPTVHLPSFLPTAPLPSQGPPQAACPAHGPSRTHRSPAGSVPHVPHHTREQRHNHGGVRPSKQSYRYQQSGPFMEQRVGALRMGMTPRPRTVTASHTRPLLPGPRAPRARGGRRRDG